MGGLPYIVEEGQVGSAVRVGEGGRFGAENSDAWRKIRQTQCAWASADDSLTETKYGPEQGYSNLMNIFSQVQAA